MNQAQIKHTSNRYYRQLRKNIKRAGKDFELAEIHQFRVEYKKLRAYLRMISQHNIAADEIKISKELKSSYHIFGSIRDLQLQQQRILAFSQQELKIPTAYLPMLQKEINQLKLELEGMFLEKQVSECKKKSDAALPGKFPLKRLRHFANKKRGAMNEIIFTGNYSDDNIHIIRKTLKDWLYGLKIFEEAEHAPLPKSIWDRKNEPYYIQFIERLGDFQNKRVAIDLIKPARLTSLSQSNRELMERLRSRWLKDKLSMKRLIIKQLKTDFAS